LVIYYKDSCKSSVCSPADTEEVWKNVVKGESVKLWCNGAKQTRNDTDSDDDVLPPSRKTKKRLSALDEKKDKWKSLHRLYEKQLDQDPIQIVG